MKAGEEVEAEGIVTEVEGMSREVEGDEEEEEKVRGEVELMAIEEVELKEIEDHRGMAVKKNTGKKIHL